MIILYQFPLPHFRGTGVKNHTTGRGFRIALKWRTDLTLSLLSDQCQISPAASQEILRHTVWRTWLFIAYSGERWLYYKFLLPYLYIFSLKGWENVLFELRSERVNAKWNWLASDRLQPWLILEWGGPEMSSLSDPGCGGEVDWEGGRGGVFLLCSRSRSNRWLLRMRTNQCAIKCTYSTSYTSTSRDHWLL